MENLQGRVDHGARYTILLNVGNGPDLQHDAHTTADVEAFIRSRLRALGMATATATIIDRTWHLTFTAVVCANGAVTASSSEVETN